MDVRALSVSTRDDSTATASSAVVVPLALQLRPRVAGAILDAGFALLRFRAGRIAALSLTVMLPLVVVPSIISTSQQASVNEVLADAAFSSSAQGGFIGFGFGAIGPWGWVAQFGNWIAMALIGVGVASMYSGWLVGRDPGLTETLGVVVRRSPIVIIAFVVAAPMRVGGVLACGIGSLFVVALTLPMSPVIALERFGPWRSYTRSMKLVIRRIGPVIGVLLMTSLVAAVIQVVVGIVGGAIGASAQDPGVFVWLTGGITLALQLLFAPLHAAWASLVYFDLRVRTEGLDIESDMSTRFPSLASRL